MPASWTERRARLRAWLMHGAGPRIIAELDVDPAELDAFRQHNTMAGMARVRRIVAGLMGLNALAWLTDPFLLGAVPSAQPALREGRLGITGFGVLFLAASLLPRLRRGPGAVVLAWIGLCGLCGGVALTMGRIGGPSTPWFHYTHAFFFVSLLAWAAPLHRMALTSALVAVVLGAYFGPHPAHIADPLAGSALTHLLSVVVMVLLIGLRLDDWRLRLFLLGRAAARGSQRLEAQVARQTARIQGLLDHVEQAREDERRDIAAELHDEMGQVLTGMRLTLRVARTRAEADGNPLLGALAQLGDMMQHLGWAVRNLLVRLRPRVLDDLGFVAAAEWLTRRTDALPGLRCTWTADPDLPDLDADSATAAFRVLQESLTNAVRHAGPGHIAVRLERQGDGVRLSVVDDGLGFDPDEGPAAGMGLLGMGERARARGGRLQVHSAPDEGTRITLVLPARAGSGDETRGADRA